MDKPKDNYNGKERRKHLRVYTTLAEYYSTGEPASEGRASFVENISTNGVCILSSEEMKVGSPLSLKIYLPGKSKPIETTGEVLWIKVSSYLATKEKKHFDIGIKFIGLDEKISEEIRQYSSRNTE